MNNPELYSKFNSITRMTATELLNEYAGRMKWRNSNEILIDLGCGDGYVTSIIKSYVPRKGVTVVGSDINENMVEYARQRYSKDNITFRVLDMVGDLPNEMEGVYNHVFSFFALQFVQNQEKAFKNFYDLLTVGGVCFLCIVKYVPFYEFIVKSSQEEKWKPWIKNTKTFLSPYCNDVDAEEKITQMMENIGFSDIDVKCRDMKYVMENGNEFKSLFKAVNPYNMPSEVFDEFIRENIVLAQNLGLLDKTCNSFEEHDKPVDFNYQVLVVYATKL